MYRIIRICFAALLAAPFFLGACGGNSEPDAAASRSVGRPPTKVITTRLQHQNLIDRIQGNPLYAHITLEKGERSELADLANELL